MRLPFFFKWLWLGWHRQGDKLLDHKAKKAYNYFIKPTEDTKMTERQSSYERISRPPPPPPTFTQPVYQESTGEEVYFKAGTVLLSVASAIAITTLVNKILEWRKYSEATRTTVAKWTSFGSWILSMPPSFLCLIGLKKWHDGSGEIVPTPTPPSQPDNAEPPRQDDAPQPPQDEPGPLPGRRFIAPPRPYDGID